jgi:hypothetical protein
VLLVVEVSTYKKRSHSIIQETDGVIEARMLLLAALEQHGMAETS